MFDDQQRTPDSDADSVKNLKVAGNSFQYFSRLKSLIGHYNHSLSANATIMVSTNCPIIGEQVAVNFVAQYVTIATIWSARNTLNFSFKRL